MPSTFAADLTTILASSEAGEDGFIRTFTEVYVPATGENQTTATDTAVRFHIGSFTVEERAGGLVTDGDSRAVVSAAGLTAPTTAAKLVDSDGDVWSIRGVVRRRAAGVNHSYVLAVHR
jgi:hypothetical protein